MAGVVGDTTVVGWVVVVVAAIEVVATTEVGEVLVDMVDVGGGWYEVGAGVVVIAWVT